MMKRLIKGIHHVGVSVPDIERAILFYQKAGGFKVVDRYRIQQDSLADTIAGVEGLETIVALMQAPNAFIEIIQFVSPVPLESAKPVTGPGLTHICLQSPVSADAFSRFKGAGMSVINRTGEPVDPGGYGIVYTYGRDPFGNIIELEQFDSPPRHEETWLGHVALITDDIDLLVDFYTQLLGYGPKSRGNFGGNLALDDIANLEGIVARGAWFKTGNQILEIWQYTHPRPRVLSHNRPYTQFGYNKFTFEVDDIVAAYQLVRNLGAETISAPTYWKESVTFHARDPQRNRFAVTQWLNPESRFSIEPFLWDEDAAGVSN